MSTTGIIVPAFMGSRRFPGKPLADVGGRPLLSYAVEAARESGLPFVVATPDDEIIKWCSRDAIPHWLTPFTCRNGTERAAITNRTYVETWDRVIVLQCDEPDVTGDDLRILDSLGHDCYTLSCPMTDRDWENSNSVALRNYNGTGRLFQRAAIDGDFMRHVGVYLYSAETLQEYFEHPPAPIELSMSLEQIRTMAMGYFWSGIKLDRPLRSVNVPEDVEQFKEDGKSLSRQA